MAEVVAADVADIKPWEAAKLLDEAASQVPGGVLMITDVHAWYDLPDHGQQMVRCLSCARHRAPPPTGWVTASTPAVNTSVTTANDLQ
jgi:hypothetical protein